MKGKQRRKRRRRKGFYGLAHDHWAPGPLQVGEHETHVTDHRCSISHADFPDEKGHVYGGEPVCVAEECKREARKTVYCPRHERQFHRTGSPYSQDDAANLGLMEYYDRLRASEEPEE